MNERELYGLFAGLGRPSVLIVGDLILDRYVTGEVGRISPEAPIPVLHAQHTDQRLGGAGNVAANLRSLDAEVEVVGVVGEDGLGESLVRMLEEIGARADGCLVDPGRPTTQKTRMISGVQQMLRIDWERTHCLEAQTAARLLQGIEERVSRAGAVILSDYGKGVLSSAVLEAVIAAARQAGVPVLVDPKGRDFTRYRGATLVTPNRKEAEEALGRRLDDLEALPEAAAELMQTAELDSCVITLGSNGIFFQTRSGESGRIPTVARAVFDVTGAGDTVISVLALSLAGGLSLEGAVRLANQAAGLVVARRGAAAITRSELAGALGAGGGRSSGKVLAPEDVDGRVAEWRARGRRIAFTNGCFDVLHAGHVEYLGFSRSKGDVLLVGINDDASVRRAKGPERPVNTLADRMKVLAALEAVDAVVPFGEDTPLKLIERVTPDVLVKGEDWADKGVVGREWVEQHGGVVQLAPMVPGKSTTSILERARRGEGASKG